MTQQLVLQQSNKLEMDTFLKIYRNKYIQNLIFSHMNDQVYLYLKKNENLMYIGNRKKYGDIATLGFLVKRKLWTELIKKLKNKEYLIISERSIKKTLQLCKDRECLKIILVEKKEEIQELINIYQYSILNNLIIVLEVLKEIKKEQSIIYNHSSFLLDSAIRSRSIEMVKYVYENITKEYNQERVVLNCFSNISISNKISNQQELIEYLINNCGLVIGVNQFKYSNNKLAWFQIKRSFNTKFQRILVENNYLPIIKDKLNIDYVEYGKQLADPQEILYELELNCKELKNQDNDSVLELYYEDLILGILKSKLSNQLDIDVELILRVYLHYSIGYKNDLSKLLEFIEIINNGNQPQTRSCTLYAIKEFNLDLLNTFQNNPSLSFYDHVSERLFYEFNSSETNKPDNPIEYVSQFFTNANFNNNHFIKTHVILCVIQVYPLSIIKQVFELVFSFIQQQGDNVRPLYFTMNKRIEVSNLIILEFPNHLIELQQFLNDNYLNLFNPQINEVMSVIQVIPNTLDLNISTHKKQDLQFVSHNLSQLSKYEIELLNGDYEETFKTISNIRESNPTFIPTFHQYIIKSLGRYSTVYIIQTLIEQYSTFNSIEDLEVLFKSAFEKCNYQIVNYLVDNDLVTTEFDKYIIGGPSSTNCFTKGDFNFIFYIINNQKYKMYFKSLLNHELIIEKLINNGRLSTLLKLNILPKNYQFKEYIIKDLIIRERIIILDYLYNNQMDNGFLNNIGNIFNSKQYINNPNNETYQYLKDKFGPLDKSDDDIYYDIFFNPDSPDNPHNANCNIM